MSAAGPEKELQNKDVEPEKESTKEPQGEAGHSPSQERPEGGEQKSNDDE